MSVTKPPNKGKIDICVCPACEGTVKIKLKQEHRTIRHLGANAPTAQKKIAWGEGPWELRDHWP